MNENKKYEIDFNDSREIEVDGKKVTLYRIVALRDIKHPLLKVKKGEKGGYVYVCDHYMTLSPEGECWVDESSFVGPNSHILGDSIVFNSQIYEGVYADGNSVVSSSVITPSGDNQVTLLDGHIISSKVMGGCKIIGDASAKMLAEMDSCTLEKGFLVVDGRRLFDCVIRNTLRFEGITINQLSRNDESIEHKLISGHGVIGSSSLKIKTNRKGFKFNPAWVTRVK